MNKSLTAALMGVALLAIASPASAGIVPGVAVDGPSTQIDGAAPRIDVAPDGSAALVYLKAVGADLHPFVSTLAGGAWSAPSRSTRRWQSRQAARASLLRTAGRWS